MFASRIQLRCAKKIKPKARRSEGRSTRVAHAAYEVRAGASVGSRYGLSDAGCDWSRAERVLVLVHGRDREPAELVKPILESDNVSTLKILLPWIEPRRWYAGRYDAPLAENAAARDAGLDHITQA